MPVTSHICEPLRDAVIDDEEVTGAFLPRPSSSG